MRLIGRIRPSVLTQNPGAPLNLFEPLTFYQMERRSDDVGINAVYVLLRLLFLSRLDERRPLRLTLIGHSFGCRTLCRALARLQQAISDSRASDDCREFVMATRINLVLLQAAVENSELDDGRCFGGLEKLPGLRILITRSELDCALGTLFPLAEQMNFLSMHPGSREALGHAGPTNAAMSRYAGLSVSIDKDFQPGGFLIGEPNRLLVADLTPLHKASSFVTSALQGHHNDIFLPEIYRLIAAFCFQV